MDTVGVRADSTLKLLVVARSGPFIGRETDEQLLLSDDVSDREPRRHSRRYVQQSFFESVRNDVHISAAVV